MAQTLATRPNLNITALQIQLYCLNKLQLSHRQGDDLENARRFRSTSTATNKQRHIIAQRAISALRQTISYPIFLTKVLLSSPLREWYGRSYYV